ncbi:MAG TPA: hypothetical protein H9672_11075 [Firmicutes bacterium]|nr:hypothetical protein [Bacillota bacterium]
MKKTVADVIRGNDPLTERPKNVIQGTVSGYTVCVMAGVGNGTYWRVVVDAKPGSAASGYSMDSFLAGLRESNKKITEAVYDGKRVEVILRASGKVAGQVREILDRTVSYLGLNGYVTCCGCCGEEVPTVLSSINGAMDFLCDSCYNRMCGELEANRLQIAEKKGNLITGLVGAVLGALLGGILWVIIYQLGYIAGIAGLVTAVCALKGYEKFGGKVNAAGVVITLVIVAVVLYFAQNVGLAIEIYRVFSDYDVSFFEAYRAIPDFMTYPEVSSAFWRDLLIGYLLTAVASFATVKNMFQNSTGSYKTGRY